MGNAGSLKMWADLTQSGNVDCPPWEQISFLSKRMLSLPTQGERTCCRDALMNRERVNEKDYIYRCLSTVPFVLHPSQDLGQSSPQYEGDYGQGYANGKIHPYLWTNDPTILVSRLIIEETHTEQSADECGGQKQKSHNADDANSFGILLAHNIECQIDFVSKACFIASRTMKETL